MKLKVNSASLLKALGPLDFVKTGSVVPMCDNVLFDIAPGNITATATNLQTTLTTVVECETVSTHRVCVPLKLLLKILKEVPRQGLRIEFADDHAVLITTDSGKFRLNGENPVDFPKVPTQPDALVPYSLPAPVLRKAFESVVFALGTDARDKPAMSGIRFKLGPEGLRCTATNGNVLGDYRHIATTHETEHVALLPGGAVKLLIDDLLPFDDSVEVTICLSNANAFVNVGSYFLISRLIDERFPDFENAIPKGSPHRILLNLSEYRTALRRVSLLENSTTHLVVHEFGKNALTLTGENLDYGNSATETLSLNGPDDPFVIGFSSKQIMDALGKVSEKTAVFHLSQPNRAALILPDVASNETLTLLVMPFLIHAYA